jgi:hypothetical protein
MPVLHRYTNLAATIHLLQTRQITLLNPATWDDRNDAYFMAEYKRHKNAATVLALCFTAQNETYHHWRVFSHGTDGVRLEFDRERLTAAFQRKRGLRGGLVAYRTIKDLRRLERLDVEELPFLKRAPYQDEQEFRLVYVSADEAVEFKTYPIKLAWLRRITLSPWMSKALADSVKANLLAIDGCSRLQISRSTLVENEAWKSVTANVEA